VQIPKSKNKDGTIKPPLDLSNAFPVLAKANYKCPHFWVL
jgi:hypothetical protein